MHYNCLFVWLSSDDVDFVGVILDISNNLFYKWFKLAYSLMLLRLEGLSPLEWCLLGDIEPAIRLLLLSVSLLLEFG